MLDPVGSRFDIDGDAQQIAEQRGLRMAQIALAAAPDAPCRIGR